MNYVFKSVNLIGDALYIGPALREWIIKNIKDGDEVFLETLNDHVAPLYIGMVWDLHPKGLAQGYTFTLMYDRSLIEGKKIDFEHNFNVSSAFALSDDKKQHVAKSYADLLNIELYGDPRWRCKPVYVIDHRAKDVQDNKKQIEELKGCIIISAFSASCQSRDKNIPGLPPNKMLPWAKWIPILNLLREQFPKTLIRFVGAPTDLFPIEYDRKITMDTSEYMLGIPLNRLALIMKNAKLVVTIDNGMSHLAATQETPTFLMYPRCLGTHYILPPNPRMEYVHIDPVSVNPAQLRFALDYTIKKWKALAKEEK